MKRRSGLVSNSSSSSFTCDCCGDTESGYDATLSDFEMTECVNGHLFCDMHIPELTEQAARVVLQKAVDGGELDEDVLERAEKALKQGTNLVDFVNGEDEEQMYGYDYRCEWPAECCPVCTLANITDQMLIKYLLSNLSRERKDVEEEIRTKYTNYDEMRTALK